ncbi:DUF2189 domain-containing protein [Rubrimonas cliftonensis]|uniref:Uncharacterized membrane protein n=1 Tax=Rubrimonas cliftonensis TaxID=89524 RepID=A0A1H4DRV2_9RHOB|nr:DUF2189 domain-containing protein [Rubrimonas cliftonensis]SEA75505.1 Uncharacterized membrane protein [Rubrimonas cliftonensis]
MSDANAGADDLVGARVVGELARRAPTIRTITVEDVSAALREGAEDFRAMPAFGMAIGLLFAIGGMAMLALAYQYDMVVLVFPMLAGFALIGPFAAMGLYEASRRRDAGQAVGLGDLFNIRRATTNVNILFLGFILLFAVFVWLRVALLIYALFFGLSPTPLDHLLSEVFTTVNGFTFMLVGNAVGAGFAFVVFSITVVSFPYMLEKDVDPVTAVALSVSAVAKNLMPLLGWGLFVAIALAASWLPFFLGLIVVLPVLGHATWRLYKRMIVHPD